MDINYKQKYEQVKQQWMQSVDAAFRMGYEQGMRDEQINSAQQQAQQAQQEAAGAPQAGSGAGTPSAESESPEAEQKEADQTPNGSELDQHIQKLESMLGKSELNPSDAIELKKSLEEIKNFSLNVQMQKSSFAAKKIAKNLKKVGPRPLMKFSDSANNNLNPNQKQALSMQEKIVSDIFKSWEKEEQKGSRSIIDQLTAEGIIKG